MDISTLIFQYLNENGKVIIPHFGTFILQKTEATFDKKTQIFLPPAQQINFVGDPFIQDTNLERFVAKERNILTFEAKLLIEKTIKEWQDKLDSGNTFVLPNLGRLIKVGDNIIFQGEKISENTPDFYGLSSINLSKINVSKDANPSKKTVLWWVLLTIIAIFLLLSIAILKPVWLFGKESFS